MAKLTRTYRKWDSMIARCHRSSHPAFKYYGGRGVTVCARWRESYAAFLADMGDAPPGLWLDRRDNSKGYEPGNCRWVTPTESARNRRPKTCNPDSLRQQAIRAGLPYARVAQRIRAGWPLAVALSTPVQPLGPLTRHTREQLGLL